MKEEVSKKQLKNFVWIWAGIFLFLFFIYSSYYFLATSFALALLGFFVPSLFRYPYIFWIKFGNVIGFVNTRIIIFILFYFLFTPIGLLLKLFGKDLLDKKISKKKETYWKERGEEFSSMRNQF